MDTCGLGEFLGLFFIIACCLAAGFGMLHRTQKGRTDLQTQIDDLQLKVYRLEKYRAKENSGMSSSGVVPALLNHLGLEAYSDKCGECGNSYVIRVVKKKKSK